MFKDLILYNGERLMLPELDSFQERLKYLEENLFDIKEYQIYYGFTYKDKEKGIYNRFTKEKSKDIENRWLGVKKVGSKQLNETLKNTLDYLATYLLSCKDFDSKDQIKNRTSEDCFLYKNNDVIFFVNSIVEKFLLDNKKTARYDKCQELKMNCKKAISEIKKFKQLKIKLTNEIKKEYEYMKLLKDKKNIDEALNSISNMTVELKRAKKEIKYIECQIQDLYSEYLYITEWK